MNMLHTDTGEIIIKGISGSSGICIGQAYLVDTGGVIELVKKYNIPEESLQKEINRFKTAVNKAKDELRDIISVIPEELREHSTILESHMVLHEDKMLYGSVIETIENERVNAEWALKKVVSDIKSMFESIADPYLKERITDIVYVSERIMRNLVGAKPVNLDQIDKRVILVAHDISPAETTQFKLDRIKGFITDRGGKTSHTSIIARSLGIPSVLALENSTRIIKNDDIIIVDGTAGIVVVNPTEQTLAKYEERKLKYEQFQFVIARSSHLPAETTDGFCMRVMGNIELPEEVVSVIENGGDGIGLFRTEFLYLSRHDFPDESDLFKQYREIVEKMAPKPVTIRTLDINGEKALSYTSDYDEINPALGLRAIRFCLKRPDVFKTQLRAILRAAAFGNVRVLFPMISSYEEICEAKKLLRETADSLDKEGLLFNSDIDIGIMIEVPSAVILADVMADAVDFFSIGTNDLVQYSLAIDRGNRQVAHLFQPLHPAVLRMLKQVVDVGHDKGVDVFMCGEMAADPINMPVLLGLGIKELSMNPQSMPVVKNIIRSMSYNDSVSFFKQILTKTTTDDVMKLIQGSYSDFLSGKVYAG